MSADKITVLFPVIHLEPWQRIMSEAALQIMQETTAIRFNLCIIETQSNLLEEWAYAAGVTYLHFPKRRSLAQDLNDGITATERETDFYVHTGNDIFLKPGWLEALLACFAFRRDCGIGTLAASDMKHEAEDCIQEGVYGPLFMFRKGYKFDALNFPSIFSDTDLIMRVYTDGFKSYRNWSVVVGHMNQQTYALLHNRKDRTRKFEEARERFRQKHQGSGLFMFRALYEGFAI